MPRCVNRVTLIGAVAADPECRVIGGDSVARFDLLDTRWRRDEDGGPFTVSHRLKARSRLADYVAQVVRTGDRVYIEGMLSYEGARAVIEVRELVRLGTKEDER